MLTNIASGLELFHTDVGSGEVVVLLHGFPIHHAMWQDQIDVLGRRYRVIAPDLRGFGGSGVTPGTVSMERMADDVAELLDELAVREPIHLAGLSMGGYVAFAFWQKHRDRALEFDKIIESEMYQNAAAFFKGKYLQSLAERTGGDVDEMIKKSGLDRETINQFFDKRKLTD